MSSRKANTPTKNIHSATHAVIKVSGSDLDCSDGYYGPCIAFQVFSSGDVAVTLMDDSSITIPNVSAGARIDLQCKAILDSGTTASDIIAYFNHGNVTLAS